MDPASSTVNNHSVFSSLSIFFLWVSLLPHSSCNEQPPASSLPEGVVLTPDSISIFYQQVGAGTNIVVIPLGFWLYEDFKHLATDQRRFIFYDMRGRGRSSRVEDTLAITIQHDVQDLEFLRQSLGIESMTLIGESYLGLMVAMYASGYPRHVNKLIQIGPVPMKFGTKYDSTLTYTQPVQTDTAALSELYRLYGEGWPNQHPLEFSRRWWEVNDRYALLGDTSAVKNYGPQWGGHLKYENEQYPNFDRHLNHHFKSIQSLNLRAEDFNDIQVPVLVIHGTKDRNAPLGSGVEWSQTFPNANLLKVEGAGHVPWIEQPDVVFGAIDDFLE